MELKTASELIVRLKRVREEKRLSLPDVMTTLRRVFSEGSETSDFSYDRTIRPIVNALLEEEAEAAPLEEIDLLKAIIRQKNVQIDLLKERVDSIKLESDRRLSFLRDQIEKKDRRMDEKDEIIKMLMEKCLQSSSGK